MLAAYAGSRALSSCSSHARLSHEREPSKGSEPAIVAWPARIPADQVIDEPSSMYDWLATFAHAAGIPAPARSDGVSLLPLLTGGADSVAHPVYVEYFNNQPTPSYGEFHADHRGRTRKQMQLIRMGDFSGVRYDIQSAQDDFEIYNVTTDPQQADNLAADPAFRGLQERMKKTVLRLRRPDESAPRPYDDAPIPAVEPHLPEAGLTWSAYPGSFPWVSHVEGRTPSAQGTASQPDPGLLDKPGMLVFEGLIQVPHQGQYQFTASSDADFLIRLHQSILLEEPGQATATLEAGFHPIRIYIHRKSGNEGFTLNWTAPDGNQAANFWHEQ